MSRRKRKKTEEDEWVELEQKMKTIQKGKISVISIQKSLLYFHLLSETRRIILEVVTHEVPPHIIESETLRDLFLLRKKMAQKQAEYYYFSNIWIELFGKNIHYFV